MAHNNRPAGPPVAVGVGLDLLPWLALAAGAAFVVPPALTRRIPSAPVLVPALLVSVGALVVLWRRWKTPDGNTLPATSEAHGHASTNGADPRGATADARTDNETAAPHTEETCDTLTGLADRPSLLAEVEHHLDSSTDSFGILAISLDEYRDVTDSFGYDAGQQLVTTVATRIDESVPSSVPTARIAEDTFALLLVVDDEDEARRRSQNIVESFSSPFRVAGHELPIEASAGIAVRTPNTAFKNAEEMLQASYTALHQGRRNGRSEVTVFRGRDTKQARWLRRRERLRKAIGEDELTIHYQPVVHLVSGEVVGAEALVRWDNPDRGLLPPAAFLPLAEETGLVGLIDRWVFERALQQASEWTTSLNGPVDWVSVNISPQSTEGDLQSWCRDQLSGTPLADGGFHLEITERWALADERTLRPLRNEGLRLSIDDFGTGYSSLRYLQSLDADVLKIDRQFIADLGHDPKTTAIVQFLLNLSLRLDVEVVAEGVETARQVETLRKLGCAMAQGFYFSEPVPPDVLTAEEIEGIEEPPANTNGHLPNGELQPV